MIVQSVKAKKRRRVKDGALKILIWASALFAVGMMAAIVIYILWNGLPHITGAFLTDPYRPGLGQTGIWPMIVSTLALTGLTILIATPIGILAAVYLAEYAKKGRVLSIIRFATESLAGIPSILYGLFGFALFVTFFKLKYSILAGALTLSVMVLPVIIRTTEEALLAVPQSYREGSLALGAGKLTTLLRAVMPSAIGGIVTSVILSIGRIVGETAALIYTMGTATAAPRGVLSSGRTLSVHLYFLAKEGLGVEQSFAAAAVLLLLVAGLNLLAGQITKHLSANKLERRARRAEKRAARRA
nr:phosphate ABC transporter permease PstA [Maliibacterium massiliense]